MLSPSGEAAHGDRFQPLDVPVDAALERLKRRVAALERQLEARIEQVATLEQRLAEGGGPVVAAARESEARAWREVERLKAEHEALMNTLTMRVLRRPRDWYGAARRRLGRLGRP